MDSHLLGILRCPTTGQPLRAMRDDELTWVERKVGKRWTRGLVSTDGEHAYPIDDDEIIGLLPGLAVTRGERAVALRAEKEAVQRFYDEVGWSNDGEDFADATLFEDLRPVVRAYIEACHARVGRHLRRPGRYLLDVASGPVQYGDYLPYADGYEARLCIDLSRAALKKARRKLGDAGRYVLGDITRLPLADDSVDGVVSLHTIYHVPADEQERAFLELHRVLRPGCTAAVVYSWKDAPLTRALMLPAWPLRRALQLFRRMRGDADALYFHPHTHAWFASRAWPFVPRVMPWRSIGIMPMRAYVHGALGGASLLRAIFALEDRYPDAMGRLGEYPLILIDK